MNRLSRPVPMPRLFDEREPVRTTYRPEATDVSSSSPDSGSVSGSAAVLWGLFPPPLTLRAALARLSGEHAPAPVDVVGQRVGGARRICAGHLVDTNISKMPRLAEIVLPDLAITGTPTETFAVKVVGYGVGLALLGPVLWAAMGAVGVHLGFEVPTVGVLVLGAAGAVSPFVDLHKAAERRRRHFCHSLSTYASLVSMAMAGAMGWSSALEVAAGVSSTDWAMDEIAQALLWAQAYRKQPWEGLERLAARFNLPDLADLARAMAQAGDGARIRDSSTPRPARCASRRPPPSRTPPRPSPRRCCCPACCSWPATASSSSIPPSPPSPAATSDPYTHQPTERNPMANPRRHCSNFSATRQLQREGRRQSVRASAFSRPGRLSFLRAYVSARTNLVSATNAARSPRGSSSPPSSWPPPSSSSASS